MMEIIKKILQYIFLFSPTMIAIWIYFTVGPETIQGKIFLFLSLSIYFGASQIFFMIVNFANSLIKIIKSKF